MDFSTANIPPAGHWISVQSICCPGLYDNVNITPLASCHWKYAARGPHYVALGPHDAALGPRAPLYGPLAASWGPLATCLALGRHIFQCPSARGVILFQLFIQSDNFSFIGRGLGLMLMLEVSQLESELQFSDSFRHKSNILESA